MITDLVFGGIVGLVGGITEKVAVFKTKKLELEIAREEAVTRTKIASIEATAKVEAEDAKALGESFKLEPKKYGIKWLDILRGSIRPVLTVYLCLLTTLVYLQTRKLLGIDIPIDIAADLLKKIIDTVLFLTVTACSWWFGSRGVKSK